MAEAAYSEDGKYYCAISHDGRLRVWDTETNILKQEYTPDFHLTSPPSCLQWINVSHNSVAAAKSTKRKSSTNEQEVQCIVLGTTSGKVLVYSVAQAKVETVLVEEKNSEISKITSLDWHRKYGLYSCNKDSHVIEWDIQNASVRNRYNVYVESKSKQASVISAIKIVPHNQRTTATFLVTASWQLRLWRLQDGAAIVVRSLGHSAAPQALLAVACLDNRSWLIEGSRNERLLSFWDVTIKTEHISQINGDDTTPSKKQRRKSISETALVNTPIYNFVLEDAPKLLDVDIKDDNGTRLLLAAATRSGVVHYYDHMLNGTSNKPIKPSVTIQVTTADANPLPLQCCHLPRMGDLVLGYTSGPALVFERVTPDLTKKTQVLIRGESKESKKSKVKQTNEVNKVRSDDKHNSVTYVEPMGGVSRKRDAPGGKVEIPMEERLSNLALDVKSRSKSAVNQNLTKLLVQGLHSKDKGLIMTVLQKDDPGVAQRTVASLPPDYVAPLLEQLADMATRRTAHCAAVCTWVSALLVSHAALLLAAAHGRAADRLAHLLAILTHRRSHLCQLLNLKGRLDLTMAQRGAPADGDGDQADQQPLLNYNDTSSEEEMDEVEGYQSDSDRASWEDDKMDDSEGMRGDSGDSGGDGD